MTMTDTKDSLAAGKIQTFDGCLLIACGIGATVFSFLYVEQLRGYAIFFFLYFGACGAFLLTPKKELTPAAQQHIRAKAIAESKQLGTDTASLVEDIKSIVILAGLIIIPFFFAPWWAVVIIWLLILVVRK